MTCTCTVKHEQFAVTLISLVRSMHKIKKATNFCPLTLLTHCKQNAKIKSRKILKIEIFFQQNNHVLWYAVSALLIISLYNE